MDKWIIGIDGGGTKTLAVLYDFEGREIARALGGFSNFSIDETEALKNIEQTIQTLVSKIPVAEYELWIQLGIAGATKMKDKGVEASLEQRFHAKVRLDTDAMIGLYSVEKEPDQAVIMAIGGTGSAVITLKEEAINTIGGYGHLLGDEGSAYHVVISAFKNLIYESEHNLGFSPLSKLLLKEIEGQSEADIIAFIYNKNKSEIAGLSPKMGELARTGDELTLSLYQKEGEMLGEQIYNAYKRFIHPHRVKVAPRGSFVLQAPAVKTSMIAYLKDRMPSFDIEEVPVEPVKGAYHLAIKHFTKG